MKKRIIAAMLSLILCMGTIEPMMIYADQNTQQEESEGTEEDQEDQDEDADMGSEFTDDTSTELEKDVETETTEDVTTEIEQESPVTESQESEIETADLDEESDVIKVEDGSYELSTALASGQFLTVQNGSSAWGAKVVLWNKVASYRQQVEFVSQGNGWYVIRFCHSGLVLDVQSGSGANGAKVQQYVSNGTAAQLWCLEDAGNGYVYIRSKLGTYLDCTSGSSANGTSVQMYQLNKTAAQKWKLNEVEEPDVITVSDGVYQLTGCNTDGKVISIKNNSKSDYAGLNLSTILGHTGEQFRLISIGDGWYTIMNVNSGKVLDVASASTANGAKVQQYVSNGTYAQQWRFVDAGDGYVYIQSRLGTVIDRKSGGTADGTELQMYTLNNTAAQKWMIGAVESPKLVEIEDGAEYIIATAQNTDQVLDVNSASKSMNANIQLWQESAKPCQRFKAVALGDGWYKLVAVHSGLVLDVQSGSKGDAANVQQYVWNGTDAQKWRFVDAGNGTCYIQSKLGTVLDCTSGSSANGTNIQTYTPNRTVAQRFKLYNTSQTNYVHVTKLTEYSNRVTLYNPSVSNIQSMEFAVWSDENGTDDVHWYVGTANGSNSWTVVVNSSDFTVGGNFTMHIYANTSSGKTFVCGTTFTLKINPEGWVYINGYRRYRDKNGQLLNNVSHLFNPSQKRMTVDCYRGIVTVYGYNSATGSYDTPICAFYCSVGRSGHQTPSGTYRIYNKYSSKIMNASDGSYHVWAPYISCFNGAIYFHGVASISTTPNQIAQNSWLALGSPASSGCVRLAGIEAKWVYENCPIGTTVYVGSYSSPLDAPLTAVRYAWTGGNVSGDPTL